MDPTYTQKSGRSNKQTGNQTGGKKEVKEYPGKHAVKILDKKLTKEEVTETAFSNLDEFVDYVFVKFMKATGKVPKRSIDSLKEFIIYNEITNYEHLTSLFESPEELIQAVKAEGARGMTKVGSDADLENKKYFGKLSSDGVIENWKLGNEEAYSEPSQEYIQLVHMAFNKEFFNGNRADLTKGTEGEFGTGFYLVTGHNAPIGPKSPQGMIRTEWRNKSTGKAPDDLMYFKINKKLIRELVDDDETCNFVLHMLTNPSGYPLGMNEDEVIAMINKVNEKGKILLFPDDKERVVVIDKDKSMSVEGFEQSKPLTDHIIVIGPQKPPSLAGLRQTAFRNVDGDLLINRAERSWGKYREEEPVKKPQSKGWDVNKDKDKKTRK